MDRFKAAVWILLAMIALIASKCTSETPTPTGPGPGQVVPVEHVGGNDQLSPNQQKGYWAPRPYNP